MNLPSKQFQIGQQVTLTDLEHGYQVTILPGGQAGLPVVEVGADYVVVDDEPAGVKTRIPMHCICAVTLPVPVEAAQPAPVPVPELTLVPVPELASVPVPEPASLPIPLPAPALTEALAQSA